MSDGQNNTPAAGANGGETDLVKNLKSEMDRKLGNIQADLKKSSEALAAQLAQLTGAIKPAAHQKSKTDEDKELETVLWDNPAEFKNRIIKEADVIADRKLQSYLNEQTKRTQQLSELYGQYPELQQAGHTLSTRAVEVFNGLSDDEKASPAAFKLSVAQAASELGIKPVSRRSEDEMDDFTLKATGKTRKSGNKPKINQATENFAQLMGLDLNDEKVKKEIEAYSSLQPTEWIRWK